LTTAFGRDASLRKFYRFVSALGFYQLDQLLLFKVEQKLPVFVKYLSENLSL